MESVVHKLCEWLEPMSKPMAIVMIGNSGSGKSTIAKGLSKAIGLTLISSDAIRAELSPIGDELDQSVNHKTWNQVYLRAERELLTGNSLIIDATQAKVVERRRMTAFLRPYVQEVVGIFVDPPLQRCLDRNSKREKPRPVEAIYAMGIYLLDRGTIRVGSQLVECSSPKLEDGFTFLKILRWNDLP